VKNIGTQDIQNYRNPKEAKNVKIVEELSRSFFMTPAPKTPQPVAPTATGAAMTSGGVTHGEFTSAKPSKVMAPPSKSSDVVRANEELLMEAEEFQPPLPPPSYASKVDSLDYYA
jgi:hypothetical protein